MAVGGEAGGREATRVHVQARAASIAALAALKLSMSTDLTPVPVVVVVELAAVQRHQLLQLLRRQRERAAA